MFGHKSKPSKVYAYGATIRKADLPQAVDVLRTAHRYRNKLVELEHRRREAVDDLCRELSPTLRAVEAAYEAADEAAKAAVSDARALRAKSRKRKIPAELSARIKAAKALKSARYKERKALRADLFNSDDFQERQKVIEADHKARWKAARAACGLHFGTYLAVEEARGRDRSGPPPVFRRFGHSGRIAVQIQGGGSLSDACAEGNGKIPYQLQIDGPLPGTSGKRRDARIRIGSDEQRKPIWLPFIVTLHRPIPEDGVIKRAWLMGKKHGTHIKWELQLVIAREEWPVADDCATEGMIAVDVGWRLRPNGDIRVATWRSDVDGEDGGELCIPREYVDRLRKCEDLQSIRDKHLDAILPKMSAYRKDCASRATKGDEAAQAFCDRSDHVWQWRSPARLAGLILWWRDHRVPGDEAVFDEAEAWRQQDKHLYDWQGHQRKSWQRWRKNLYRNFAADLSRRGASVVIEDVRWTDLMHDDDENDKSFSRVAQRTAAVGMLCDILRQRFRSVIECDPRWTTRDCHACGQRDDWDQITDLRHTCSNCGADWDQDENACWNLLRLASEAVVPQP